MCSTPRRPCGRGPAGDRSAATSPATASTALRRCDRRRRRSASRPARARRTNALSGPCSSAVRVGQGDTRSTGAPARRAVRSTTTCVHARSVTPVLERLSCSSTTTTAASPGHGPQAAIRLPITTSVPPAATAQSCGSTATDRPLRRNAAPTSIAWSPDGTTTSVGPSATAPISPASGRSTGEAGAHSAPGEQRGRRRRARADDPTGALRRRNGHHGPFG